MGRSQGLNRLKLNKHACRSPVWAQFPCGYSLWQIRHCSLCGWALGSGIDVLLWQVAHPFSTSPRSPPLRMSS
jgi:hypothetical protein